MQKLAALNSEKLSSWVKPVGRILPTVICSREEFRVTDQD